MSESQNALSLSAFFSAMERRLTQLTERGNTSFQVTICGHIIELRFLTEKQANEASISLAGRLCTEKHNPEAVLWYWSDDCSEYIGKENSQKMLRCKEDDSYIFYIPYLGLTGVDATRKKFYRCLPKKLEQTYLLFTHALYDLFHLWARTENMLMIHAAAVGIGGKGVLITGKSGSGKSSLSIGCLLDGMDFVADDYTLVNEHGPLLAFPLYTSVLLNPDMAEVLKPDMPVTYVNPARGNRLCFDASAHPFCPQLRIHAVIAPTFSITNEPLILRVATGSALTRMAYSTVRQMGVIRDPEPVRAIVQRFLETPVYEIQLSSDLQKNVTLLRNFIKEEL